MLETQLHHYYPVQLLTPMSTTSQNHSATTGLLPRNILTGKIKHWSNNFLLMNNFPKCWLACLLSGHSIFLLPIPESLSLMKRFPKEQTFQMLPKRGMDFFWNFSVISPTHAHFNHEWSPNFRQMLRGLGLSRHGTPPKSLYLFIEANSSHVWFPLVLHYRVCPSHLWNKALTLHWSWHMADDQ